uniref:Phospholipase-like protein n=1 Tax=Tanacetum cinerariifolium TaxID=118510 RepID=A0A6L2LL62_TANCI|nr:phospholipase-like protein [Tanacetum cinerariifolium]
MWCMPDEERFGKLSDDDTICICLLLALEVIFIGRLLTFKVDDTLFRLVENLEASNSFPWGENMWCHLYNEIKNLKQRHNDDHYYGLKKDRNYVPTYALFSFVLAFQESRSTSNLGPTIAEYQSFWWIDNNIYFQEHVPRAPPIKEHHSLFETYLEQLEKARKRGKTCFIVSSNGGTNEEMLHCEHEKLIVEDNRFRLDDANMLRLEEENMLQLEEQKKNKRNEFINSSHDRNFWLKLVCLDLARKGWLTEEVSIPINEMGEHWCLAEFHILSGEVTFYDTGYTYDYDYRDSYVRVRHCLKERHEQKLDLQTLVGLIVATESIRFLKEFLYDELEETRGMMRLIYETQLKVHLPVVLEHGNVFQKKGIDPSKYTITFRLADNVPKQRAYMVIVVCGFIYFENMDQDSAYMVVASKVPMLKPVDGVITVLPITTAKEKTQRRLEVKARNTLMIDILNEHQLKFNSIKDAKQLLEAVEKRFALKVNAAFSTNIDNLSDAVICAFLTSQPNSPQLAHEDLEQIYPNDIEKMDLRWQMAMLTWSATTATRGEPLLGSAEFQEIKTSSIRKAQEGLCLWKHMLLQLWCHVIVLVDMIRVIRLKKDLTMNSWLTHLQLLTQRLKKLELIVLSYKTGLKSVEERLEFFKNNTFIYLEDIKVVKVEIQMKEIANKELMRKLEVARKENDGIQLKIDKFKNASKSLNKLIDCQIVDNYKKDLRYKSYNAISPPYTGNFMPSKPDLPFTGLDEFANKPDVENKHVKFSEEETKFVRNNPDAPIIMEWVSNDEEEIINQPKIVKKTFKPIIIRKEFVKLRQKEKTARKTRKKLSTKEHVVDKAVYKELDDKLVRAVTTASSLETEHDNGGGPRCQEAMGDTIAQSRFENVSKLSNDSLHTRGNTLQSDKDSMKLNELMKLCTNLQSRVLALEETKTTQALEITTLKRRVKKFEKKQMSRTDKLKRLYKVC